MGHKTDSAVEFLDLYPTFVDYCGFEATHMLSGKSLRPVLEEPTKTWNEPAYTQVVRAEVGMGYSVCQGSYRYTQWGKTSAGGDELYNHIEDPIGYYNLAEKPEHAQLRSRMAKLLQQGFPKIEIK